MRWRPFLVLSAMLFSQFDLAASQTRMLALELRNIRTVPTDTLGDLAAAVATPGDPVIYYNPRLMEQFGPEISAFVLAHEAAHIQLGHRRPDSSVLLSREALEQQLQAWELEADCAAAARLSRERPSALAAAAALFQGMGHERVDREHPTGTARAATLASCGRMPIGDLRWSSADPRVGVAGGAGFR